MTKRINAMLAKMLENLIHRIPVLTTVGQATEPAPNSVVTQDCERYCGEITKAMNSYKKVSDEEAKKFIMNQAELQHINGHLPPLPEDHGSTEMAIWLGKAKILGFLDVCVQAWRLHNGI